MAEGREIQNSVMIATTQEMAFEAVTRASELREWFSDEAWTEPAPHGRFDLRWRSGYRSDGRFIELDRPRRVVVSWRGSGEPGQTTVELSVEPAEGGAQVRAVHAGFGPGKEWDAAYSESRDGWAAALENLKSVMETGIDLRVTRRPFLGITLSLLDRERAVKEGIAADAGIYVEGTVEGSRAAAAGIQKGDVLVSLGGRETPDIGSLQSALGSWQGGDQVEAILVRGRDRLAFRVTLGKRPIPELFASAAALADRLAEQHAQLNEALRAAVAGVTEEEAETRPAPGEWSAKEVLAHLSTAERAGHEALVVSALNGWYDAEGYDPGDFPGVLDAALSITPALQGLVERFIADEAETVALLRSLPAVTMAHRARFRRIGQQVLFGPDHTRDHIGQIERALKAARPLSLAD